MKRPVLALAVVVAAVAVAHSTAGAQAPGPRTINLVERDKGSSFGFIDNRPRIRNERRPILSPGDAYVFSSPLFDEANRAKVGRLHVQCTVTKRGTEETATTLCTGVFKLRDGQIVVNTVIAGDPRTVTGAVTGGDGAYAGARGTFRSTNNRTGSVDVISLLG